jgi:hypothetical protein
MFPAFLLQWNEWRKSGSRWGGALLLYPAVFVIAYTLGSLKLGNRGALGVDPDAAQWWLYVLGLCMFLLGACLTSTHSPSFVAPRFEPRSSRFARLAGLGGLGLACINFATGGITALSSNVNAARFGENSALLGPATGIIVGVEQFAVVVLVLERRLRRKEGLNPKAFDSLLIFMIMLSLLGTGSRTFLILPLVAIVLAWLETHIVKSLTVLVIVVLGFVGMTGYNYVRQQQSGTSEALDAALDESGLSNYPLASGLLSLQIGPRVFQVSREVIPQSVDYQRGDFFMADGAVITRSGSKPSDFFTTTVITGRSYAMVGGSPPTVLGGLYIDGGIPLIAGGMFILGFITRRMRDGYLNKPTIYAAAAYGYWGTWMMHSVYNYVSFKPMVLTFLALCAVGAMVSRPRPLPFEVRPPVHSIAEFRR